MQKMLADEFGTASNIKSRVNRQSVLGAITSCQQRLKLYNRVSRNQPPTFAHSSSNSGRPSQDYKSTLGGGMHMEAAVRGGGSAVCMNARAM